VGWPEELRKIRVIRVIRGKNPAVKHEELTGDIMGAAMAVLNELKPDQMKGRSTTDFTDFTDGSRRGEPPFGFSSHRPSWPLAALAYRPSRGRGQNRRLKTLTHSAYVLRSK
jgi:hypothetical protein